MRYLLLLALTTACGDNSPPCDTDVTTWDHDVVWCDGLPNKAVCVRDKEGFSPEVVCRPLCAETVSACTGHDWWHSITVIMPTGEKKNICYCEPGPADPDRGGL